MLRFHRRFGAWPNALAMLTVIGVIIGCQGADPPVAVSAQGATSSGARSVRLGATGRRPFGSTMMVPRYVFIQQVKGYPPGVSGVNVMVVV